MLQCPVVVINLPAASVDDAGTVHKPLHVQQACAVTPFRRIRKYLCRQAQSIGGQVVTADRDCHGSPYWRSHMLAIQRINAKTDERHMFLRLDVEPRTQMTPETGDQRIGDTILRLQLLHIQHHEEAAHLTSMIAPQKYRIRLAPAPELEPDTRLFTLPGADQGSQGGKILRPGALEVQRLHACRREQLPHDTETAQCIQTIDRKSVV